VIDGNELLRLIDAEIESRLVMTTYEKNEFGEGYDCCGCSTPSTVCEDIEAIIKRLMQA
jgi:hypothetical protein